MNPILFLDIDGVLNSVQYAIRNNIRGIWGLDPVCVALLQQIVIATNCHIVISSTWRRNYTLVAMRKVLSDTGMIKDPPIIGYTPVSKYRRLRGDEIEEWIDGSIPPTKLKSLRYVCLDDDDDFLPDQPLVRTNIETGLTEFDARKCIALLLHDPSKQFTML